MVDVLPLRPEDWPAVAAIFTEGIATGLATFETETPSWEDWDADHLREHRFVAVLAGEVVGWPRSRCTGGSASGTSACASGSGSSAEWRDVVLLERRL